jgi:hypothetical protein
LNIDLDSGMLLSACILIVGTVPRLVDPAAFKSIWLDGSNNLACAVGFVTSGWVCDAMWLKHFCALGFVVSIVWFVNDLRGHNEPQTLEVLWSVFSLLTNCSNFCYHMRSQLHGMYLVFKKSGTRMRGNRMK